MSGTTDIHMVAAVQQSSTSHARKIQLDTMINHMPGVQILHKHFIETDVPALAAERARTLGWTAEAGMKAAG